jgi:predicted transposase YbfD/YdcC
VERRTLASSVGLNQHLDWPGVAQVCRIQRERRFRGRTERETVYFVTSLSRRRANAALLLQLCRRHWGAIENGVHYVRDMTFGEDRCTISCGHAPQNLAAMRNAVLNWLRRRKSGNLAATIRSFTRNPQRLFAQLGFVK